jgi:hypothetical protein
MMAFLEQDEIDALDRQEILQNIDEGGWSSFETANGESIWSIAWRWGVSQTAWFTPTKGKHRAPAITGKQLLLEHLCRVGMAGSFTPNDEPPLTPTRSPGAIMFKRRATGQQILQSEPAAPSMAPAPAPITTSDSNSADLAFLHHMSDDERKGNAGEQPLRIQFSGPTGFNARGYMFRRLNLRP